VLNKTAIRNLRAKPKVYRALDSNGLYLEVRTTGEKYWRLRYTKPDGRRTLVSLGHYPDVSIEAARESRDSKLRVQDYQHTAFREAAEQWYARQSFASVKNRKQVWNMIERYLLPTLGDMRMSEIKPADILPILKDIERRGMLEQCKRVRGKASQIFRYGVANLMCEFDPAHLLRDATKKPRATSRAAITEEAPFRRLLRSIDQATHLNAVVKMALQISPYVFLRSAELRNSTVGMLDFDKKLWVIPGDHMKMKRDHIIPLHDTVIERLQKMLEYSSGDPEELIFPGMRKGRPLSENTFNVALRSLGYDGDTHVHHGFRASFATLGREVHQFDDILIERQLAHVDNNQVRAAYDRSYRIDARATMLRHWGDYLDQLRAD